jgi:hypothetical protein
LFTHVLPVLDSEADGGDAPVEENESVGEVESVEEDVCVEESAVLLGLVGD